LIVAGIFVAAFVLDVFSMLFVEQPDNVLLLFPNETIYGAVDATQRGMEIVLCLAACASSPDAGERHPRRAAGRCSRASRAPRAC
jgi:hypothetical protein